MDAGYPWDPSKPPLEHFTGVRLPSTTAPAQLRELAPRDRIVPIMGGGKPTQLTSHVATPSRFSN